VAALAAQYPGFTNDTITKLLEYYPDDALIGCPYGTGDGVLPSGLQDKRSLSIGGDLSMHAGVSSARWPLRFHADSNTHISQRRLLAQTMAKTNDVFSYRFDQPPDNATMEIGSAFLLCSSQ
jgi:acetylcholinesterase